MATYNGSRYIKEQLTSILMQLGPNDEVIISDDSSSDDTLAIIASCADNRIKLFPNQHFHSPIFNFENALKKANGDYIFLADQDDIWKKDKVQKSLHYLEKYSLVISNCSIIDKDGHIIKEAYSNNTKNKVGVFRNIICNNYLGCCMAFKKEVLDFALPFPKRIAMHDIWIGLCADAFLTTCFIPDKLIYYRRHGNNASPTSEKSQYSFIYRIKYRFYFICQLLLKYIRYTLKRQDLKIFTILHL